MNTDETANSSTPPHRLAATPLLALALLVLVVAGVACGGGGDGDGGAAHAGAAVGAASGGPRVLAADEDLYRLAAPLAPGNPGDVIAIQQVPVSGLGGTVWRVLYHSRSLAGADIAVSGVVAVPEGPVPAGGRPVLSWAHGTTGMADECAPSKHLAARDIEFIRPLLDLGVVYAATDYEGLGTPGRHPYLVGESEARGVLDAARAARNLGTRAGASDKVVIWGHSQGGHAALFANQFARQWAPELDVLGTVAGAPPSQLPLAWNALRGTPGQYYLAMVTAGWAQAYPHADPTAVFTPAGVDLLDTLDQGCTRAAALTWNARPPEAFIATDPTTIEPWSTLLQENDPGHTAGAAPVLIVHGEADEVIPLVSSQLLLDRMCRTGQVVERRTYPGGDHRLDAARPDAVAWVSDRIAGGAARTSCPT